MFYAFVLAERLHMTVKQLLENMTPREFELWVAFNNARAELAKKEPPETKK